MPLMTVCILIASVAFFFSWPASQTQAGGRLSAPFLEEKTPTIAPYAFVKLCVETPRECRTKGGANRTQLNSRVERALVSVNRSVNKAILPGKDNKGNDAWRLSPRSGDCEDYAVTKRKKLIDGGLPPRSIRLAMATTPNGEAHVVVIVKTPTADLVLDNRNDEIKPVNKVDLHWLMIESADNPKRWRWL
ncbi:transglutaminase-like cysteine peptidase [Rhizobium cremeum]|uniref:transglutaminase-like cysteine peptidase n=1 Tax=Rhizobium cremeum TaxID=2813827 RepID=UPI000DD8FE30|nr:transglutaminase-like cysteine peptidase [Rhizobium cremeum]MCJ7994715.1 transglutaminase-like cysteine peptidase [Rhizobium cremeum]MCJ8000289.1 transglutaminase-like cysteine peptidase [Rhizobium cremeum]